MNTVLVWLIYLIFYLIVASTIFKTQKPLVSQGLLIIDASRSHSGTPHSVGPLWSSDQPDAETSTWQHMTLTRDRHLCNTSKQAALQVAVAEFGSFDYTAI